MTKIKLLLSESREIHKAGYIKIFQRVSDIELVAVCTGFEETIINIEKFQPDIVLIGVRIRGGDRIELAQKLKALYPQLRVLLIFPPIHDFHFDPLTILKSNVDGFISGDTDAESLIDDITNVYEGYSVVPSVYGGLVRNVLMREEKIKEEMLQFGLSRREQEVLSLVAKGLSNHEIAENLVISQNTVKLHVNRLLKKLHVKNRQQAASKIRNDRSMSMNMPG
jgi:DNA-binding NarL/FixJ family response regulator